MTDVTQVTWQDAGPVDWAAVEGVLNGLTPGERGWYEGAVQALFHAQAQTNGGRTLTVDIEERWDWEAKEWVRVDPLVFLCVAAFIDDEAYINLIKLDQTQAFGRTAFSISICSTETDPGVPRNWPKLKDNRDVPVWRPFAHAVKLRTRMGL